MLLLIIDTSLTVTFTCFRKNSNVTSYTVILFFFIPARRNYLKCLAGENLYISLEGINLADANLYFSGEAGNYTLVRGMEG